MRHLRKILCAGFGAVWASTVLSADERVSYVTRDEIVEIWADAANLSMQIEDRLFDSLPTVSGWACAKDETRSQPTRTPIDALPMVHLRCTHANQSLRVFMVLDARSADTVCAVIESTKYRISTGTAKPDLFRFFETEDWQIKRGSVDLTGCSRGVLALIAKGARSEEEIANGPTSIDEYAEAILRVDVAGIVTSDAYLRLQEALSKLTASIDTQSDFLLSTIPHPDRFTPDSLGALRSDTATGIKMPLTMVLGGLPSANATIDMDGCQVLVNLYAGPNDIHEAKEAGSRWASPGRTDRAVEFAFMRHNTERVIGRANADGTSIAAFVDDRVIVKASTPGNRQCENNPSIVSQIFNDILDTDFSDLGVQ